MELADALENAAHDLILLKLFIGSIVVFGEIANQMKGLLNKKFLLVVEGSKTDRDDAVLKQFVAVLWTHSS
jgi:hypothetical protein